MRFEMFVHNPFGTRDRYRVLFMLSDKELVDDIGQTAFSQGDVARVMDNYGHDHLAVDREHAMHQWMEVTQGENLYRVRRVINLAISEVEHMLFKWAKYDSCCDVSKDNRTELKSEYVIELRVPHSFTDTTASYLLRLIHDYVVDRVLYDWANLTYPEAATYWMQRYTEAEQNIRRCSHKCNEYHKIVPTII